MDEYFKKIEEIIKRNIKKDESDKQTFDILQVEYYENIKKSALKLKQFQMKIGKIWQEVLGVYDGWEDLGSGHRSELDLRNKERKLIIELKNRTNTDNNSSRNSNYQKLINYQKSNEGYISIYATLNDTTELKTKNGFDKIIIHNGEKLRLMCGYKFLNFFYGDEQLVEDIINFMKKTINSMIL